MLNLKIETYCVSLAQTNCYIAINTAAEEGFVVDPGASAQMLAERVKKLGIKPAAILLTHGHFDHAGGAMELSKLLQVPIYAHQAERETLEDPRRNLSGMMTGKSESYQADVYLKEGQPLNLAGFSIQVFQMLQLLQ